MDGSRGAPKERHPMTDFVSPPLFNATERAFARRIVAEENDRFDAMVEPCPECDGTGGWTEDRFNPGLSMGHEEMPVECPRCGGTGEA